MTERMSLVQRAAAIALLPKFTRTHIDAMGMAILFQREYKEHVDWHEFAMLLDELRTKGILRMSRPGGNIGYQLVRDE